MQHRNTMLMTIINFMFFILISWLYNNMIEIYDFFMLVVNYFLPNTIKTTYVYFQGIVLRLHGLYYFSSIPISNMLSTVDQVCKYFASHYNMQNAIKADLFSFQDINRNRQCFRMSTIFSSQIIFYIPFIRPPQSFIT